MHQVLLDPVDQLEALSQNLLRSLAPPPSSTSKPPLAPPISSFLECDIKLADAVQEARIHQAKQREIDELTAEVLQLDSHLREIVTFLADGKDALAEIIAQGDERLHAIDLASKSEITGLIPLMLLNTNLFSVLGNVSYSLALGYASILANFTSAPPTMDRQHPDKPFDAAFRPPFPTEEMMRKGKMNEEPPLGSLGETREVGRRE